METSTTSTNTPLPARAAQYVRMSTEHQQYSPENQLEVICQYAASHTMEIVQEYSDHGRSGLNCQGRSKREPLGRSKSRPVVALRKLDLRGAWRLSPPP